MRAYATAMPQKYGGRAKRRHGRTSVPIAAASSANFSRRAVRPATVARNSSAVPAIRTYFRFSALCYFSKGSHSKSSDSTQPYLTGPIPVLVLMQLSLPPAPPPRGQDPGQSILSGHTAIGSVDEPRNNLDKVCFDQKLCGSIIFSPTPPRD